MNKTAELIPVTLGTIGQADNIPTVDGRDIWETLEIKRGYAHWVRDQIEGLQLVENEDFVTLVPEDLNQFGLRPRIDYFFTIDSGKHIAMVSKTEKGKEIRAYFIGVEKAYRTREKQIPTMSTHQLLHHITGGLVKHDEQLALHEERLNALDGGDGLVTIAMKLKQERYKYPGPLVTGAIGKRASQLSRERGLTIRKIPDAKYGSINAYENAVLSEVLPEFPLQRKGPVNN